MIRQKAGNGSTGLKVLTKVIVPLTEIHEKTSSNKSTPRKIIMATKKKGALTTSRQRAKHLRPYEKRVAAKAERKAGVQAAKSDYNAMRKRLGLNELSKRALGNYVGAATDDAIRLSKIWHMGQDPEKRKKDEARREKKINRRFKNVDLAVSKMKKKDLSEMKKSTLKRYVKKAKDQAERLDDTASKEAMRMRGGPHASPHGDDGPNNPSEVRNLERIQSKASKRWRGVWSARDKINKGTKREVNELSAGKYGDYIMKSMIDAQGHAAKGEEAYQDRKKNPKGKANKRALLHANKKGENREQGVERATRSLVRKARGLGEDNIQELSKELLLRYKRKSKGKQDKLKAELSKTQKIQGGGTVPSIDRTNPEQNKLNNSLSKISWGRNKASAKIRKSDNIEKVKSEYKRYSGGKFKREKKE
jgi:hypothetical protein